MYSLLQENGVILALIRDADNASIPLDLANADFYAYMLAVEAGEVADLLPEGKLQELKDAKAAEIAAQGGL